MISKIRFSNSSFEFHLFPFRLHRYFTYWLRNGNGAKEIQTGISNRYIQPVFITFDNLFEMISKIRFSNSSFEFHLFPFRLHRYFTYWLRNGKCQFSSFIELQLFLLLLFYLLDTNASHKGFSGCIYSLEIDDVNLFDEVVQEPRPADIQMIPNESEYIHH